MRLLVITHTFPPSVISNAKRPYYVVRALLEAGWKVDVFTSRLGTKPGEPETVAHQNLRILRPPDPFIELTNQSFTKRWARWATLTTSAVLWPDNAVYWARKTIAHAVRHRRDYDRVLAYVLPASVLLAGRQSDLVDRKWVFDFQESVSPHHELHPRRSPLQRASLSRTRELERRTLAQAGKVIFTAETNRQSYLRQQLVAAGKTIHIPYFYDSSAFANLPPVPADRFEVSYFGSFDWRGERSPETFLQAFAAFLTRHPEARSRSCFSFYGAWLQEHHRFIEELKLQDIVSINPAIPYAAYLERLKTSPILLLVVSAAHNLFMPSKIVDYFGAQRPILAFVNRRSEMRQVLDTAGMSQYACDEFDVEAAVAALERLWKQYQEGWLGVSAEKVVQWSSTVQLARYRQLLEQTRSESS